MDAIQVRLPNGTTTSARWRNWASDRGYVRVQHKGKLTTVSGTIRYVPGVVGTGGRQTTPGYYTFEPEPSGKNAHLVQAK